MRRPLLLAAISLLTIGVAFTYSQQRPAGDMVARIRAEGLQRSKALALYRTLTDDIGARLTGSPAHMRAAGWARDRFQHAFDRTAVGLIREGVAEVAVEILDIDHVRLAKAHDGVAGRV